PPRVSPPVTVARAPLTLARSRSPGTVTPLRVPPEGVNTRRAPSPWLSVPPARVPPARFHEPVAASRARVAPALFKVPVRLTVPPAPLTAPRPAVAKLPPRLTVPPLAVMAPALDQAPPSERVPPPWARRVPVLVQEVLEMLRVPPAVSALT